MNRVGRGSGFDWRDLLHLPGIVPPELASVRIAAIAGGLVGGLVAAYFYAGALPMLAGGLAGAYVSQTAAFAIRRVIGEDFLAIVLRAIIRIAFGLGGTGAVAYAIYGALQIASNGRLWAIGGVGFFACPGICMLVAAVAPNVLFQYRKPAIGVTLGCICVLLTLMVVASMVMHPSLTWIGALLFCAGPAVILLKKPSANFRMSPEEMLCTNGFFGLMLKFASDKRQSPPADVGN